MGQHRPYVRMLKIALDNLLASGMCESTKKVAYKAFREVDIRMSGRQTVTAGKAGAKIVGGQPIDPVIILSKFIFGNINDAEKFNTVSHEFAHIVDYYVRGTSNHDAHWQRIHLAMGGTAARTHSYQVKRRMVTRYIMEDTHTGRILTFRRGSYKNALSWGDRYKLIEVKKIQR